MVCSKCQKLSKKTTLATPEVKKKNDIYHGSATSSKGSGKAGTTLANAGVSKVRFQLIIRELRRWDLANNTTEQTPLKVRQEPVRAVLQLLHQVQDQGVAGLQLLPVMRIPERL